jgi:8-oxo-dGTP pyrophosphatase MutT (NUDIX family)
VTASDTPPAKPRPAATVVLARDRAGGGIEVFLVQRHGGMGFMGGMHVFPGGSESPGDASEALLARVERVDEARLVAPWGRDIDRTRALALALTAVRETLEEAGVLLGAALDDARRARMRERLLAGEDFAELLAEHDLRIALDGLTPISRWVTPAFEPKRFDTLFFLARAPHGQGAEHDQGETVASTWLDPEAALARRDAGEIRLAPPTSRTLEALLGADSVDAARERVAARRPPLIEPILRVEGDAVVILYPGDPEHPEPEPAFPGPTRHVLRRS